MDNISIASDSEEEHGSYVKAVMDTLWLNDFKLKERKCIFGRQETEHVGYRVTGTGIRMLEEKIESIASWLLVSLPKETCMFL
jgi:hypothetical protein